MSAKVHRVFAAQNAKELAERYDEWATAYEADMGDHGGPREAVETLARYTTSDARVLDAGCGTGLSGKLLAERGYRSLEGLDLSTGMLREAAKKGCYAALHQGALGEPLSLPSDAYDAVLVVGVFVRGHAPSRSLEELVRITKPGGHVLFTLRPEFHASTDFPATMAALEAGGAWEKVETTEPFDPRLPEFPEVRYQVWVYRKCFTMPPAQWNATEAPFPSTRCIHHLLEEQVARTPHAVALVFENRHITYAELNARANRLAHHLTGLGVGPETLVGLCLYRTPEILIAILGILKAGGAYVPIDPAYPKIRQKFIAEDTVMPVLVTVRDLADDLPVTQAKLVCVDRDLEGLALRETNPEVPQDPHSLLCILFTSGSTGRPKGVALQHNNLVNYVTWAHSVFPVPYFAGMVLGSSVCFDLSLFEIFAPLACGGAVILAENLLAVPTLAARERITFINSVPSAVAALLGVEGVPASVRIVVTAGELLVNKVVQDLYRLGTIEKVYNLWGPCETTIHSSYYLTERGATKNPPIGKPIGNTQIYIVDENLQLLPVGMPGEVCLGGEGVARGYWNRPDLTESKFLPSPFGPGRIYRSGDMARYLPDGNMEFVSRMDHQVKIRGFRVELGEIETTLEEHPAIDRAVVLALPDAHGEKRLVSYVVANPGAVETLAQSQDTSEQIEIWRNLFEQTYSQAPASPDPTFNTSGWISSYTNQPIPEPEMREWLDGTVERILALRPKHVLELGCGTGMIAVRVAPHCESYVGLDLSGVALDHIRTMRKTIPGLDAVALYERAADELHGFEPGRFDTVVVNSVVQLFPGVDYLLKVIDGVLPLLKAGGHILLGDLINRSTLETFQTSLQYHRAADGDTSAEVRRRIHREVAQERDLALSPGFFLALGRLYPQITHFQVLPRRGRARNELSRFRYDALLEVSGATPPQFELPWLDWSRDKLSLDRLRQALQETHPASLAIRGIPNGRLSEEVAAMAWLREAGPWETMANLRAYVAEQPRAGVEPEDLWALESLGYRVELSWLGTNATGCFDAVWKRAGELAAPAFFPAEDRGTKRLSEYCNHPQRAKLHGLLIPQLRQFLKDRLPHYMMPAVFTVLDQFPLSPNNKIDRKALEQLPVTIDSGLADEASVARTPLQRILLDAWADALDLSRVGLDDDFFELGGNSLKAVVLIHRLQRQLGRAIRPVALMQAPTVARFAAFLESSLPETAVQPALKGPIQPTSFPQRRFWSLQQLNPSAAFYNDPFLFRLRGPLDAGALRRSLDAMVARHEILRTTLQQRDGELWQVIAPAGAMDWIEADLCGVPAEATNDLFRREVNRPFDLGKDPGLRAALVRTQHDEYLFQVCFHNTSFDLVSLGVVLHEASAHYAAFVAGALPDLPPPPQYSDYVRWQDSLLESGMEERRRYWEDWFRSGEPPAWEWTPAKGAPPDPGFESHVSWVRQSPARTAELQAMCRGLGVTPYIAVLAALFLTVRHYTGCDDITIGTTHSNRPDWRFSSMIGASILVPALRVDCSDNPGVADFLRRVRDVVAAALTHQDVPVDQVLPRDPKKPLFRVVCSGFPETPHGKLLLPGIEAHWIEDWIQDVSRPDLYVVMWQSPGEQGMSLTCHMMHKQDVFGRETSSAMAELFEKLLDAMTKDTGQCITSQGIEDRLG